MKNAKLQPRHPAAKPISALLSAAGLALGLSLAQSAQAADPVVLSFATVGDSRQDPSTVNLSGQDSHWLQNTRAFARILAEAKGKQAKLLMFNGDMIMGYGNAALPASLPATPEAYMATDLAKNYTQYAFWRGMVAPSMEAGMYVVPVPGNHEVQCSTKVNASCASANGGKNAYAVNENAWRANMSDLILDTTRFTKILGTAASNFTAGNNPCPTGGACSDNLTTDQTSLSYSFDVGSSHFVVINTDAVGRDSHAPTEWITSDLAAAKARGAKSNFVFGHKPAYSYYYAGADTTKKSGLDVDATAAAAFWAVIQQYGATYFCGHEHIFNLSQPQGGTAYQVLVGSGGSPFDAPATTGTDSDHMYAYSVVRIHQSGRAVIFNYGFKDDFSATTLISGPIVVPAAQ